MKRLQGFSLMEMMIVLTIVAIVAAASAPMVNKKMVRAASERSPWVFTNGESIGYNIDNPNGIQDRKTATIGRNGRVPNNGGNPRLYIDTNSDTTPHILFGNSGDRLMQLIAGGDSRNLWFSNRAKPAGATNSVALGYDSRIVGSWSTAVGPSSRTITTGGTAFGAMAESNGVGSIAIGLRNQARGNGSITIGKLSNALAGNSIVIGPNSNARGANSIAIGSEAAISENSTLGIAIGRRSTAGQKGIAIGSTGITPGSNAESNGATAANFAIAMGDGASGTGLYSIAMGHATLGGDSHAIALGTSSSVAANSPLSIAIGRSASVAANSSNAIAIGRSASVAANSSNAIAIGRASNSFSDSIAIGANSTAITNGITIGCNSVSNTGSWGSIVIGAGSTVAANSANSIAIGRATTASGGTTLAMGFNCSASSNDSVVLGRAGVAENSASSIAIGHSASVQQNSQNSIAIGHGARAEAQNAIAIGRNALASSNNTIVLGTVDDTVIIPGKLRVSGSVESLVVEKGFQVKGNTYLGTAEGSKVYVRVDDEDRVHPYLNEIIRKSNNRELLLAQQQSINNINLTISDRRLKNVGKAFTSGLDKIKKLEVFNYTFKDDKDKTPRVGVMAQDLQKIFPDAVVKGEDGFLRIRMEDMFYAVINAIKELDIRTSAQEKKIKELEKQNKELLKRIEALEKRV